MRPSWKQRFRALPQIQDVTSDLQVANPQLTVEVDHDKAYALGLTPAQVSDALYSALWHAADQHHLHPQQ